MGGEPPASWEIVPGIGTPVHSSYYAKIPDEYIKRYDREKLRLISSGINVLDMTTQFYNDSCFADADHLNAKGTYIFTRSVINSIAKRGDEE